jgi:reactive intermediate/imine deaminase
MDRRIISTPAAPAPVGPYSQAVRAGDTVYLSGQIALDPESGKLVEGGVEAEADRAFRNLKALAEAAGGSLGHCVKLTLFLVDMGDFAKVNDVMVRHLAQPFPARTTVAVAALPRGARFEVDAVMVLD